MKEKIIFLVGPTAVGKSEVAVSLAKKIHSEIISCDSMQVYQGMEILSSAPSLDLRKKIPHHLIGIIAPHKEYNVSRYRIAALKKIKEVLKRKKIPLLVGGTGLYFKILLDGIFVARSEDKQIRYKLYQEAEDFGKEKLFLRLKEVDPEAALRVHPHDLRRMVRALEVYETTGIPISKWQKKRQGLTQDYELKIFGLNRSKKVLRQRIDKRLEQMFKQGLIAQVKELLESKLSKTAKQALGIKEISGYLNDEYSLEKAKGLLRGNTYKYVKKQLTWFKKDKRIKWINIKEEEDARKIAKRILKEIQDKSVSLA